MLQCYKLDNFSTQKEFQVFSTGSQFSIALNTQGSQLNILS